MGAMKPTDGQDSQTKESLIGSIHTRLNVNIVGPPGGRLSLRHVAEDEYKKRLAQAAPGASEPGDADEVKTYAQQEVNDLLWWYRAFPEPHKRLEQLLIIGEDELDRWPPYDEWARSALVAVRSDDEEAHKEVFRRLYRLERRYERAWKTGLFAKAHASHFSNWQWEHDVLADGSPMPRGYAFGWDWQCALRISLADGQFRDVQIRREPADEELRVLCRRRDLLWMVVQPGAHMYWNGKKKLLKRPDESTMRVWEETKAAIARRKVALREE
jgi:hypothetical protein